MKTNWTEIASELNYAVKNYVGLTKMIVQIRNRAHAYGIEPENEQLICGSRTKTGKEKTTGLETLKGMASRKIERILKDFPIWMDWLVNVPGIGPVIGGQLVALYYFKSIAVCKECGADLDNFTCLICKKESRGLGVLKFRSELRNFATISSWWHFMGRHVVDNKVPKRRIMREDEDENPNDWSNLGRKLGYDIKESFNKLPSTHKYKAFAEKRKQYRLGTHPDATKGHRHNMAWNETVKLFLSHFWQVAHTLDGLEMTKPWCVQHGGHDPESIIAPYYFNGDLENKEAA